MIIVGPSHYVAFSGASIWPRGAFDTPLGPMRIDEELASAMLAATVPEIHERPDAHVENIRSRCSCRFLASSRPA